MGSAGGWPSPLALRAAFCKMTQFVVVAVVGGDGVVIVVVVVDVDDDDVVVVVVSWLLKS